MGNLYVDDSASGGANDGSSWSDAWTSITSVSASDGDVVYVASTHDESLSGTTYIGGSDSSPVHIVSATAGSDPPSYAAGATIRDWDSSSVIRPGSGGKFVAWWGMTLAADGSSGHNDLKLAMNDDSGSYFFGCTLKAVDQVYLTTANDSFAKYTSCSYEILASATSGSRYFYQSGAATIALIQDGSFENPHRDYALRKFYGGTSRFRACDFSDFSELHDDDSSSRSGSVQFSGCSTGSGFKVVGDEKSKKIGSVTTSDYSGSATLGEADAVAGLVGCVDFYGETKGDTSRYRDAGAKDSLTGDRYSHEISGQLGSLADGHNSTDLITRTEGGSPITVTLHVASGGTLHNDELWFDLFGPSDGSSARQHFATTRRANPTVAQAELASDSEAWTGSGVGTKQKISYTYTPHHAGLIHVVPVYAKGSGSVWVCPKLEVS